MREKKKEENSAMHTLNKGLHMIFSFFDVLFDRNIVYEKFQRFQRESEFSLLKT